MLNISDPTTYWIILILAAVLTGICLLIAVAFTRRWQQNRYAFYLHTLQRIYRPRVAKVLAGARSSSVIETLRELPPADLENLLDPLFSNRKLSERQLLYLQSLCSELGLIRLWQSRVPAAISSNARSSAEGVQQHSPSRATQSHLLRAQSIRNLGKLRHHASWPLLVNALDDRHADIQLVALRSLGAVGAPESFGVLRERLHAAVLQRSTSAPVAGLVAAMANFDISCAPALFPSLNHLNYQIRLHALEILRAMIVRATAQKADPLLSSLQVTPRIVELLVAGLAIDAGAEIRAGAAEVIVYLSDPRITPMMSMLLKDAQWVVRQRCLRALGRCAQAAAPLHTEIRDRLQDRDWRVREAAAQALIALGPEGKDLLYEHFLTTPNFTVQQQIVEVMTRTGQLSTLLVEYSQGQDGLGAFMVEQMVRDASRLGISGVLRSLNLDTRLKFLDRLLPAAETELTVVRTTQPRLEANDQEESVLELRPRLAA